MQMDPIELLKSLKTSFLEFIEDLMVILPEEKDLILFHIFIKNQVPIVDVMKYIQKNIVPLEDRVEARDEQYFKENAVLFEKVGDYETEVNRFKMLWEANEDEGNREMVWQWFKTFIYIGKKYTEATAE